MAAEDFIPAVKGSAVPVGELGFPNIVPIGNRQAQQAFASVQEGGYSYWMDLTKQAPDDDIYGLARFTMGYTNPTGISGKTATAGMAEGYGMPLQQLRDISDEFARTKKPGSIVFSRITPDSTSSYTGGGERWKGISRWQKCCPRHKNVNSRRCTFYRNWRNALL